MPQARIVMRVWAQEINFEFGHPAIRSRSLSSGRCHRARKPEVVESLSGASFGHRPGPLQIEGYDFSKRTQMCRPLLVIGVHRHDHVRFVMRPSCSSAAP